MSQGPILCVDDEPTNLGILRQILKDSTTWCSRATAPRRWSPRPSIARR